MVRPDGDLGVNPEFCQFQSTGPEDGTCDEDQFSYPEFGPNGDLYVHFLNFQHQDAWEIDFDFDSQVMVTKAGATDGVPDFGDPVQIVDLEDGGSDMPFTVIGSQSPWGHQIRWTSAGTISVNPTDPDNVAVVFSDRGTPNPNATEGCYFSGGEPPDYDPCDAGPGSDTNVYMSESTDGGETWSGRELVDTGGGAHQWFPWADHLPDGRLAIAWDEDTVPAGTAAIPANDEFRHVLWVNGGKQDLLPNVAEGREDAEVVDISVTYWAGQYVPQAAWPVGVRARRLQRSADCRRSRQGLQRLPRRLHGLGDGVRRQHQCRLDRAEPVRRVTTARLLHRRTTRRLRSGRDVRASFRALTGVGL